jgi:hypothetical protein
LYFGDYFCFFGGIFVFFGWKNGGAIFVFFGFFFCIFWVDFCFFGGKKIGGICGGIKWARFLYDPFYTQSKTHFSTSGCLA